MHCVAGCDAIHLSCVVGVQYMTVGGGTGDDSDACKWKSMNVDSERKTFFFAI